MKKSLLIIIIVVLALAAWQAMKSRNSGELDVPGQSGEQLAAVSEDAGDGAASADETPQYGGVLKWRGAANPPKLDPHFQTDTTSARVIYCLFDTLVVNSLDGQGIEPWLAESWSASDDGLTWTFRLRPGVFFHKET